MYEVVVAAPHRVCTKLSLRHHIGVMIAIVRMIVMDAHICTILNRMMPTSWYWELLVTTRLHVFKQKDDYKLVLGAICPHERAQRGPDCSPSTDYLCFLSTQDGSGGPSEVAPHSKDPIRPPFPLEKRVINELCPTMELSVLQKEN